MSQTHAKSAGLPLAALRALEAAARHSSFRDAAAEIGLTPSAVSHHVRQLEASLGIALFRRLHRGVEPTEAGLRLAAGLGRGFTTLADAWREARPAPGRLVLSAAPGFAARWLIPAMPRLAREGIALALEASVTLADVAGGTCDVAVRLAPAPPPGVHATRLTSSALVMLASPVRMAGREMLRPTDLAAGPLFGFRVAPGFWRAALTRLGLPDHDCSEILFDAVDDALAAAEAGHGLAYAPIMLAAERLSQRRLVVAHPRRFGRRSAWSYWFLSRPEIRHRRDVQRLRAVLRQVMGAGSATAAQFGDAAAP